MNYLVHITRKGTVTVTAPNEADALAQVRRMVDLTPTGYRTVADLERDGKLVIHDVIPSDPKVRMP